MEQENNETEKWGDENSALLTKLPDPEDCITKISVNCIKGTKGRWLLFILGALPIFFTIEGRGRAIIPTSHIVQLSCLGILIITLILIRFLSRHERGRLEVYPEMLVLYLYDHERKEARFRQIYYWKDIVQYNKAAPYIWFGSVENDPVYFSIRINLLFPYLEKYAPQAEAICCNMKDYFEKKQEEEQEKE